MLFLAAAPTVQAGTAAEQIRSGANEAAGSKSNPNPDNLETLIARVINIFSVIIGVVAVIMLIYGGFRYITSAGNDAGVQAAKNTIIYAIIGLVVVALAQVIVKFVLTNVSSTTQQSTIKKQSGLPEVKKKQIE